MGSQHREIGGSTVQLVGRLSLKYCIEKQLKAPPQEPKPCDFSQRACHAAFIPADILRSCYAVFALENLTEGEKERENDGEKDRV